MKTTQKASPVLTAVIVIGILGAGSAAGFLATRPDNSGGGGITSSSSKDQSPDSNKKKSSGSYKDGMYTAKKSYATPGGQYSVDLTVNIADNTVKSSTVKLDAKQGETSSFYQNDFADMYKSEVVGKKVNDISLDRVGGSSLTSNGFNDALDQIKDDAKA